MSVVKLEISGLLALGFDRVQADALLHLLRQIGAETGGITLPELAADTAIDADPAMSRADLAELRKEVEALKTVFDSRALEAQNTRRIAQLEQQIAALASGAPLAAMDQRLRMLETAQAFTSASSTGSVDWERPGKLGAGTPNTAQVTTLAASGQISSTLATGTAPLSVASTTKVANLNADQLDGKDWAAPDPIGSTTPNSGAFTSLTATTGPFTLPSSGNTASFNTNGTNAVSVQFGGDEATGYSWQRNIQQNVGAVPHRIYCFNTLVATHSTTGLQVVAGFGCNGKTPQAALALGAAAVDLPTVITLANNLRTALIANGIGA
jgi:hypothetical protein